MVALPARPRKGRRIFVSVAAAMMFLEILYSGTVAHLVLIAPSWAIWLKPHDAQALLSVSEAKLLVELQRAKPAARQDQPSGNEVISAQRPDQNQIKKWVETAVIADPLNAKGLRLLGQLLPADKGVLFMEASARRSLHESVAVLWLAEYALSKRDISSSLQYFDILLRTKPLLVNQIAPVLSSMIENPISREDAIRMIAAGSNWRDAFLSVLPQSSADPRTAQEVFVYLDSANIHISQEAKNHYISYLFRGKYYDLAYESWLQLLPSHQLSQVRYVFNGNFSIPLTSSLFDWNAENAGDAAVFVENNVGETDANALNIRYGYDREVTLSLFQYFKAPPGKYVLRGEYMSELSPAAMVKWQVRCLPDGPNLPGKSAPVGGRVSVWTSFHFNISIPETGCGISLLQMLPNSGAQGGSFSNGTIKFRKIEIIPG